MSKEVKSAGRDFPQYSPVDEDDMVRRAMAAWFRSGGTDQPAQVPSGIREHLGKRYVALENVNGILAVYRIKNDGILKCLKRWPKDIETY